MIIDSDRIAKEAALAFVECLKAKRLPPGTQWLEHLAPLEHMTGRGMFVWSATTTNRCSKPPLLQALIEWNALVKDDPRFRAAARRCFDWRNNERTFETREAVRETLRIFAEEP